MKKVIIILLILLLLGGLGIGYYFLFIQYDPYELPEEVVIDINENKFNIYEEHTSKELVKSVNADIISKEIKLENNEPGTYKYTLEIGYKKRKYKKVIEYNILDMTEPVFISAPSTLTMEASDEHSVCEKIVYADNYDSIPTCKIEGTYDKTVIGTYPGLKYIVSDKAGNQIEKDFTLNIVSKIKNTSSYSQPKYIYMNEILNNYKNEGTSIGIDVSKWQGNVDFNKVRDAGIEFVIMRIGSQRSQDEEISMDVKFKEYYAAVKEAGLKVGVYVYNTSASKEDGIKTAKWVIKELNGDKLDFPVAYDWEDWSNFMSYKMSLHTLSETYKGFEEELKRNGYEAMLYSSKYYLENVWMDFDNTNIWLANYTSKTEYKGKYMMWQMTSSAKVSGITDNTVDIDILYKDLKNE